VTHLRPTPLISAHFASFCSFGARRCVRARLAPQVK
jgi:hypothetical protein